MEEVRRPVFYLEYEQKDITAYITPSVLSVAYTDYEHGMSDEIDIEIEDGGHLWKSSWYPAKGDALTLRIGYENEGLLPCGTFEIDEVELSAPPDVVSLKGLGTNIKKALRQENTKAYENRTLMQIASEIAKIHGLELVGEIKEIRIGRITQMQERDLGFLRRIAEDYGYIFKVADGKLVFYETERLEAAANILVLDRKDMTSFRLRDKTHELYKDCEVSYHDPKGKKLLTHTVKADGIVKGDTLKINERCETREQAAARAKAALRQRNGLETEGTIAVAGDPRLAAGSNIEVAGLYALDGKYHIRSSRHSIDRSSGYKTEMEVRRVA